jgi:glycerol-3-phosphate dehydrogenase
MTEGKRILFAIPWGERTILGTSDTDYQGSLDNVRAEAADINYVLGVVNQFFPRANLSDADLLSTWAGLRPLIADTHGKPSEISRSHEIRNPEPGWWDVAGGKLTTYRLMAEETVDQVANRLKSLTGQRSRIASCRTAQEPLLPPAETEGVSGILPPAFTRQAVEHYVANEWAVHLDDVMVRRTNWQHYLPDARARAAQVAEWMGALLGWPETVRVAELKRYEEATDWGNEKPVSEPKTSPVSREAR